MAVMQSHNGRGAGEAMHGGEDPRHRVVRQTDGLGALARPLLRRQNEAREGPLLFPLQSDQLRTRQSGQQTNAAVGQNDRLAV